MIQHVNSCRAGIDGRQGTVADPFYEAAIRPVVWLGLMLDMLPCSAFKELL